MSDPRGDRGDITTARVTVEGADLQMLAGVNDGNLVELGRATGARVALRGDHLSLTGEADAVAKAEAVAAALVTLVAFVWIPNTLAPGYGLFLLVLWPLTLAWTLMPYAYLGFGDSPWAIVDLSPGSGARLITWTDYLLYRVAASFALNDIEVGEGGLSLVMERGQGEPARRLPVWLPGGSVSADTQVALIRRTLQEHPQEETSESQDSTCRSARASRGEL